MTILSKKSSGPFYFTSNHVLKSVFQELKSAKELLRRGNEFELLKGKINENWSSSNTTRNRSTKKNAGNVFPEDNLNFDKVTKPNKMKNFFNSHVIETIYRFCVWIQSIFNNVLLFLYKYIFLPLILIIWVSSVTKKLKWSWNKKSNCYAGSCWSIADGYNYNYYNIVRLVLSWNRFYIEKRVQLNYFFFDGARKLCVTCVLFC